MQKNYLFLFLNMLLISNLYGMKEDNNQNRDKIIEEINMRIVILNIKYKEWRTKTIETIKKLPTELSEEKKSLIEEISNIT